MNASLAQRNGYQVKCDELNLAQLSGRLQWRRRRRKKAVSPSEKDEKTRSNRFLEAKPNPKSRTYVADRTPAKEPNLWKREGEALTSPGHPLTNLTTVKLSRKRCPKTSGRTCVESMLCKVHPELYIPPLNPTHKQCTWPVPFQEVGCAVLIWSGAVKDGNLLVGLIWSAGLMWRWWFYLMGWFWWSGLTMVWCGSWCMVWSVVGSETPPIVCCCGLIWGGSYGLLWWSGCMV